jgi:hypothetical protein
VTDLGERRAEVATSWARHYEEASRRRRSKGLRRHRERDHAPMRPSRNVVLLAIFATVGLVGALVAALVGK